MLRDPSDERRQETASEALLKAVCELAANAQKRVYAVMDGSRYDDLPKLLKGANVAHRPLYRYAGGDYDVVLGGPWLIDPYQSATPTFTATSPSTDEDDLSEEVLAARSAALSAEMVSSLQAGDPTGDGMLPAPDANVERVEERLQNIIVIGESKPGLVFWSGEGNF